MGDPMLVLQRSLRWQQYEQLSGDTNWRKESTVALSGLVAKEMERKGMI